MNEGTRKALSELAGVVEYAPAVAALAPLGAGMPTALPDAGCPVRRR